MTKIKQGLALIIFAVVGFYVLSAVGGSGPGENDGDSDDLVNLTLEISMGDDALPHIQVAISASLGSAGNYARANERIHNTAKDPKKQWYHKFRAKRGEKLNAEVANLTAPVKLLNCFFYQQDEDPIEPGD